MDLFLLRNIFGQVLLLECTGDDTEFEGFISVGESRVIESLCVKVVSD